MPHPSTTHIFVIYAALLACLGTANAAAPAKQNRPLEYKDGQVYMRIFVRTPDQLAAFYQGRQFKPAAVERILAHCFITPVIRNKGHDVLWLELDNWRFSTEDGPVQRIKRDYWRAQWQAVDLRQAHQSTFGWTLMPEARDLRLDESVGGSVVLPMQSKPVTLVAHFKTGKDKNGATKTITFKELTCPRNPD